VFAEPFADFVPHKIGRNERWYDCRKEGKYIEPMRLYHRSRIKHEEADRYRQTGLAANNAEKE
jgi:hypothetical protein